MTGKTWLWVIVTFVSSIGIVLILSAISKDMRRQPGNFFREFPPFPAVEAEVLALEFNSYYLAGVTESHIFLGNHSAPLHLIVANRTLSDTQHVSLTIPNIYNKEIWATSIKVDSPFYYVVDGTVPMIHKGNVKDWKGECLVTDTTAYFLDLVPLHGQSFFVRSLHGDLSPENILGKINGGSSSIEMRKGILQKQVDGIFCTDGMMLHDKVEDKLIYLYRYRNEYIVMDTSLNVLQRHHTIDTISRADLSVSTDNWSPQFSASTKLTSPRRTTNKRSAVSGGFLFVNSLLLAQNESDGAHEGASVIDVYDFKAGVYKFSFYIYDYHSREKLRDFKVSGHRLYALFEKHVQAWELGPEYFTRND